MRLLVVILAVLALTSSAMAWELKDNLQYTYTKSGYEQAGDSIIRPSFVGATSQASFYNPGASELTASTPWQSAAVVENTLTGLTTDRVVWYPEAQDLRSADFAATLTQGGEATVEMKAMNSFDNSVPEMAGEASAYQNIGVYGGFEKVSANFDSRATVGAANSWTTTDITSATASVNADKYGGGEFGTANLGASVEADFETPWYGSGWGATSYSGGLTMWSNFAGACDPGCGNPIVSSVSGSAETASLPGWNSDDERFSFDDSSPFPSIPV